MPVPDNRSVLSSMLQMRPLINLVARADKVYVFLTLRGLLDQKKEWILKM